MFVIVDTETERLINPEKLWLVVCTEVETEKVHIFRNLHDPASSVDRQQFKTFAAKVSGWIGHNIVGFDRAVLERLAGVSIAPETVMDPLVISRLLNAGVLGGHSLEAIGERLGYPKISFSDFSKYSLEMEEYCIRDTLVTLKFFKSVEAYIFSKQWKDSLRLEHDIAFICEEMKANGFHFNFKNAQKLHQEISLKVDELSNNLSLSFQPKTALIREINPKATKHGTISKVDFRWTDDLTPYSVGAPFSLIEWVPFNPGSPKQVVERLNESGWKPYEKTKGHIQAEREGDWEKLKHYLTYGWKVSEENLKTLPKEAPEAARKLVEWLTLNNRKTVLETWFKAITVHGTNSEFKSQLQSAIQSMGGIHSETLSPSSGQIPRTLSESLDKCVESALREGSLSCRIHGTFRHIGAWTHRMAHSDPNMANIPAGDNLYAHEMRALWDVPKDKLLVGVDADGIQLRILAHYMNDPAFTKALVEGRKEDGTDAHTMNKEALGSVCKSRDDAKTFIYAFLLGAGLLKVAQILGCSVSEAKEAVTSFLNRITGLKYLKEDVIPKDARKGYFIGLDGRAVLCDSEHLMLAGYLQNGESVIMKRANVLWRNRLLKEKIPFKQVNFVHDEWQLEVPNDQELALYTANILADSIRQVGEDLKLNCPMAGSFLNQHKQLAIGANWSITH